MANKDCNLYRIGNDGEEFCAGLRNMNCKNPHKPCKFHPGYDDETGTIKKNESSLSERNGELNG